MESFADPYEIIGLDEAERRFARLAIATGADADKVHLGLGEYQFDDSLPPAAFGRLYFVDAILGVAPEAIEDALIAVAWLCGRHHDHLAFQQERFMQRFGRRLGTPPASKPELRMARYRTLWRGVLQWSASFTKKYGQEFADDFESLLLEWTEKWRIGDGRHLEVATIVVAYAAGVIMPILAGKSSVRDTRWPHAMPIWCMLMGAAVPYGVERLFPLPRRVPVKPSIPAWNPQVETQQQFLSRARARFEQDVRAQLDAAKSELSSVGLPIPAKMSRDHFRWLALYQVKQMSLAAIAEQECREKHAISMAVHSTAELIGLPLRPPKRAGRPKKAA